MKRILLVDDQAHVLRVMRLTLGRNGYEVDTALSSERALQLLAEQPFDVVITDLDVPQIDGRNLCERIQRLFPAGELLTLVMTDAPAAGSSDWIDRLPHTERLEKPLSLRWLVARLNEYFGHYAEAARH